MIGLCSLLRHQTPLKISTIQITLYLQQILEVFLIFTEHELAPRGLAHFLQHEYCSTETYHRTLHLARYHFVERLENVARVAIRDA